MLFLCEKFQHEFIIFTCHTLIFRILSFHFSMEKSDLKRAATKHSQNLVDMFKRKKLSATPILNYVADPSTNIVDQSVDSSASTTLMPEVNIDFATTESAASTTLDVSSSVPEPGNTATTEDSVSTTDAAASTILDTWSSVLEQGKQATDNTKPAPVGQPSQPIDPKYDFPLRSFSNGKKQERFNRDWFKNEDWKSQLHCIAEKDTAFCCTCIDATRINLIASKNADKTFISNAFTNWQDAGTKNRDFDKRFRSETHRETHERLFTISNTCDDISAQLSTTFNETRSVNRQNLLKILTNVKLIVRQDLPLRGHGSGEDSNFIQLYILREEENKGIKAWSTKKKINKYVHSTIQNEMMQIMALRVLREVGENIQYVDFSSIMCDEALMLKMFLNL